MRPGAGCGTWAPAGSGCWARRWPRSSRSATCWSACGRPRWRPPPSRSGPRPGSRRCGWSPTVTAGTWTGPGGSGWPGSSEPCGVRSPSGVGRSPACGSSATLFAALRIAAGVIAHRRRALERVQLVAEDWAETQHRLAERRDPDDRGPRRARPDRAGHPHPRGRAVGAAAILAETGDPHRFATARALVKHAGLAPREKQSGTFTGRTKLTGKGRPRLRLAAWRAVWGALQTNTVYAARYRHLTTREPEQAQAHPGPDRDRRRDPATPPRGDHHRPGLGPRPSPRTAPSRSVAALAA